jgi:hypothetical protein
MGKPQLCSIALSLISLLFTVAQAWNTDVHNQIGFMAETFLTPYTIGILRNILEPKYNGSIGRAAAWADSYAHTDEGRFSYQWHWIDSEDTVSCHPSAIISPLTYSSLLCPVICFIIAIAQPVAVLSRLLLIKL